MIRKNARYIFAGILLLLAIGYYFFSIPKSTNTSMNIQGDWNTKTADSFFNQIQLNGFLNYF